MAVIKMYVFENGTYVEHGGTKNTKSEHQSSSTSLSTSRYPMKTLRGFMSPMRLRA